MEFMLIRLRDRTLRVPIPETWTGKIELNVSAGQLTTRGSRQREDVFTCAECGSHDVIGTTVVVGLDALDDHGLSHG